MWCLVNSLPNSKILDWFKLKAFADNRINVTEKLKFVVGRIENIVRKGKMLVTSIFSQYFKKASFPGLLKMGLCGKELRIHDNVMSC